MVYVKRDKDSNLIALYKEKADAELEELPNDDIKVLEFLTTFVQCSRSEFLKSDIELIRVIEDLINILMDKDIIHITDFPEQVIDKLVARRKIRKRFTDLSDMFSDEDDYE